MKKTLFFALLACMMFASCEKIVGDLDFINHEIEVQGTVNPTLGVPVAHGSVSVYDILQMVQVTEATIEIGDDGIVNIVYDTSIQQTIAINESKKHSRPFKNHSKSANYVDTTHNSIQGSIIIDIFDNIDSTLNGASIEVDNLYVNVLAFVKANAREGAREAMDTFHVTVFYDSLYISAVGKDGSIQRINLPNVIPVDSLLEGQHIKLFKDEDISQVINKRPVEIRYGARMNIAFESAFYETDLTAKEFVADSIGIDFVDINAGVRVDFPVSTYIKDLTYNTDLQFEPSFNLGELTIDSSMLILSCSNGLPLALGLSAALVDANGNELCQLLDPTPTTIAGASVGMDVNGHFVAVNKSNSELRIPITEPVFNKLLKTKAIRINAVLNTSETGSTLNKNVAIKSTDVLDIMVTAKIQPSYPFTLGLNNNGQKGGVR